MAGRKLDRLGARTPKIDHAIVPRHIDLRAIVLRCNAQPGGRDLDGDWAC